MASAYDWYDSAETNKNYDELWCCWITQWSAPMNPKQDGAVMGLSAQEAGRSVGSYEGAQESGNRADRENYGRIHQDL